MIVVEANCLQVKLQMYFRTCMVNPHVLKLWIYGGQKATVSFGRLHVVLGTDVVDTQVCQGRFFSLLEDLTMKWFCCKWSIVKPIYIKHWYNELCLITSFFKIPAKIPCISHCIYQTTPSVLWAMPNFPAHGDCVFTPSGD